MTTELTPPSGIFVKGIFHPVSETVAKKIVRLNELAVQEKYTKSVLDDKIALGERDLFVYAGHWRAAETELVKACDDLAQEFRK